MPVAEKIDPMSLPVRARIRIARDEYFKKYILPILLDDSTELSREMYERAAAHPEAGPALEQHLMKLAEAGRGPGPK